MIQKIRDYPSLQLLGDPRRLIILQMLMEKPATLSQLGKTLGITPARVRHHLVQLVDGGYVELVETRPVRGFTEKYYRASAQAYWLNLTLLPQPSPRGQLVLFGSHDPALEELAEWMRANTNTPDMTLYPVGSLDGLVALQQGLCHLTGCHLFDPVDNVYNSSYVRHFFPGGLIHIVTLAHRVQGLLVSPGNPFGIRGLEDLGWGDIRFINRSKGSGTRLWLDRQVNALGLDPVKIPGFTVEVNTHAEVAAAVRHGFADTGLAVQAACTREGLDFVPLFEERYDLVIPEDEFNNERLLPILEHIHTGQFIKTLESLGGYNPHNTGKEIPI